MLAERAAAYISGKAKITPTRTDNRFRGIIRFLCTGDGEIRPTNDNLRDSSMVDNVNPENQTREASTLALLCAVEHRQYSVFM